MRMSSATDETMATRNFAHLTWNTDGIVWIVAVAELRQAGHKAAK